MPLPAPVADVCARFLDLAPEGLITGLYLTGGTGFGEWIDGRSDIDFVATLAHRPNDQEVEQLQALHARLAATSRIDFDGMHILASDLVSDPRDLAPVPVVLHHQFQIGHLDQLVAWHELAWHGVTVSGPDVSTLDVWTDRQVLRNHTVDNLDTYWRDTAERLSGSSPEEPAETLDEACTWCVLGVARLHHLIVTGAMTTKSGAGRWALSHYDGRWHRVIREALRLREGGQAEYDDPASRLRDTAAFTAYVVAAGTDRP
ncbi:aminoglycoside adenylyltransferase domain-containing protein [Nocardioides ferulae]|uniref:aminoglycoside adenylyltransferase domain-containing protein n=1 Tax=Nocardioides ferulae TaxID=2340821 RepID=UPI0013DDE909|nr:aminoglycoside adenylyltransferase domain-containing protein [Nocardioides ferulae]